VLALDRGGLVGSDGPTHHGTFDLAYLSSIPNLTLASPKDGNEFRGMLHYTADNDLDSVVAIRYPRDAVPTPMTDAIPTIEWGRWELLTEPSELVILAVGTMVRTALEVAEALKTEGLKLAVVNARFVKPLDLKLLGKLAESSNLIITAEEGSIRGGFGQAVAEFLLTEQFGGRFRALGIPDRFVTHGLRDELMREINLDSKGVAQSVMDEVEKLVTDGTTKIVPVEVKPGSDQSNG
jgi:1-deoxy-D-xylulose-5-phosphate synthase